MKQLVLVIQILCSARHLILTVVSSHAQQHNTRKQKSPEPHDITFEHHQCRLNY